MTSPVFRQFAAILALGAVAVGGRAAEPGAAQLKVDWPAFLARHDLIWQDTIPGRSGNPYHGMLFAGNGLIGLLAGGADYAIENRGKADGAFFFHVNRTDVTDRRDDWENSDATYRRPRLPIGTFSFSTAGKVIGDKGNARLDLWNAESSGTLVTDKGKVRWVAWVHAIDPVFVIDITPEGGEAGCQVTYNPKEARTPREKQSLPKWYAVPAPVSGETAGVKWMTQPLAGDRGGFTTAWRETEPAPAARRVIGAVAYSDAGVTGAEKSRAEAVAAVNRAAKAGVAELRRTHRAWWHAFYPRSFVSLPDPKWEAFYWRQVYKLGSATRADSPMMDTCGPWLWRTPWPAVWWNLNVQLAYSPVCTANRLDLGESLLRTLDANAENLRLNVPKEHRTTCIAIGRISSYDLRSDVGREVGNLPWALHNYWLQYRHEMDDRVLKDKLVPLMAASLNYYRTLLEPGTDGKLHLPPTASPELGDAEDASYNLALIRWLCKALLASEARLGLNHPDAATWRTIEAKLVEYPTDDNGYMVGKDFPFNKSHRHYSHLLQVYPLRLVDPLDPAGRKLIEKSIRRWTDLPEEWRGYSYQGAASMHALLGNGDAALKFLDELHRRHLPKNTLYSEGGPVIETPLAVMQSLHELLLQSDDRVIRLFPAVPSAWGDISFHHLRAEGAFLVSGVRADRRTKWVWVESLAGEPCRIVVGGLIEPGVSGIPADRVIRRKDGVIELKLARGESAVLFDPVARPDVLAVAPVEPFGDNGK